MPQQEHIHLGFVHGLALDDPLRLLDGQPGVKFARWTTFERPDQLIEDPLRALLGQAAFVAGLPREDRGAMLAAGS
jgi:hypothetical protein